MFACVFFGDAWAAAGACYLLCSPCSAISGETAASLLDGATCRKCPSGRAKRWTHFGRRRPTNRCVTGCKGSCCWLVARLLAGGACPWFCGPVGHSTCKLWTTSSWGGVFTNGGAPSAVEEGIGGRDGAVHKTSAQRAYRSGRLAFFIIAV